MFCSKCSTPTEAFADWNKELFCSDCFRKALFEMCEARRPLRYRPDTPNKEEIVRRFRFRRYQHE